MTQEDIESYIYLDREETISLKARWRKRRSKEIEVKCQPRYCLCSDSVAYLRVKICESLEMQPEFSGLTNLQVLNLSQNYKEVQDQETVQDLPEETLSFDLCSNDLWLKINFDCYDLLVSLFFEWKISEACSMEELKRNFTYLANALLFDTNQFSYHSDEIQLFKAERGSLLHIDLQSLVQDEFDYLDNEIYVKVKRENDIKSFIIDEIEIERSIMDNAQQLAFELPVRSFDIVKHQSGSRLRTRYLNNEGSFCYSCLIF